MKVRIACDFCGKSFERLECYMRGKRHHFCDQTCRQAFSNKRKNLEHYKEYANHETNSRLFSEMNRQMNATRMALPVREKLRAAKLGTGEGKSYTKVFGVHEHRVVAEQMLGRPLRPGEVVHHRDGNKRNNTPNNLVVFESQADHAAYHAKLNRFIQELKRMEGGGAQ